MATRIAPTGLEQERTANMNDSKVCVTSFRHFDLVYLPASGEVTSVYAGETSLLFDSCERVDADDGKGAS